MTRARCFAPAALLFCAAAWGCGGAGPKAPALTEAEVVVTINGQPLPNALVTLNPTDASLGAGGIASGVTDESGRAKLSVSGKPGAAVGANKVTVVEGPAGADVRGSDSHDDDAQKRAIQQQGKALKNRPIPEKYSNLAQSDLSLDIKTGQKDYKLELKR